MASLGFAAVCVALARLPFATLFLTERAKGATGLLLGAGLFTIAIRRGSAQMSRRAREAAFFCGARWAS
jgi:hypothetical protein